MYCRLDRAGTCTTTQSYNNSTAVALGDGDASSLLNHYRFTYGVTTSNDTADNVTTTSSSMHQAVLGSMIVSFNAAVVAGSTDHFDTINGGYYPMEKLKNYWLPKKRKLWLPRPAFVPALVLP
jgi:hypothetical protein